MGAAKAEARALLTLSWPIFASGVAEAGMSTVAALFLGRDPNAALLGGAYVAISVFNVIALSPMTGLSSAVSTLAATAIGAGEAHKVGAYVQLGVAVNWTFVGVLMVALIGWPAPILRLVLSGGQPRVAAVAVSYLRLYSLALLPYAVMDPIQRALMAQSVSWPIAVSSAVAMLSNVVLHAVLVVAAGGGAVGSAAASALAAMLQLGVLAGLVRLIGLGPTVWGGWSPRAAATAARSYVRLALPGAAVLVAEWWALEMTTLFMARAGDAQALAAHVVAMNVAFLCYMAPVSVGMAVMTRVGNALGGASPAGACRACWVAVALGASAGGTAAVVLLGGRSIWPRLYSANGVVVGLLRGVAPAVAAFVAADAVLAIFGRVLRGSGRQRLGAAIYLVGYWGGVLPLASWLASSADSAEGGRVRLGGALAGMWTGLAVGKAGLVGVMAAVAVRTDWEEQSLRALRRLGIATSLTVASPGTGGEAPVGYGSLNGS
ncbi:hypothetical protein MMPV_002415 [Pyropia vietnamensis]